MSLPDKARSAAWARLRQSTPAQIGLARSGAHISTTDQLAFQLAHAQARDAVLAPFDANELAAAFKARGHAALVLQSTAPDKDLYLTRPDMGRRLDLASRERLALQARNHDVVFVVADGLSALAVHRHALALFDAVMPHLSGWRVGPIAIVEGERVAIGDEIGEILSADLVAVLIGERPGLSSPDSLGVYATWEPRIGRTDAQRNCISNVRPEGLGYAPAAAKLAFLLYEARRRQISGVMLKDDSEGTPLVVHTAVLD